MNFTLRRRDVLTERPQRFQKLIRECTEFLYILLDGISEPFLLHTGVCVCVRALEFSSNKNRISWIFDKLVHNFVRFSYDLKEK